MANQSTTHDDQFHRHVLRRRLLALVLAGTVIAVLVSLDPVHAALLRLLASAQATIARHPVGGAVLFVAFSALSAMLAFMSSAVLVPVALVAWGKGGCLLLLWIGWIVGGACSYGIARGLGRPAVAALASARTLARYEERVSRHAPFSLVLLLQLALPSELPGYLLGIARYPFFKYLLALALAELPFAVGTVFLGTSLIERRLLLFVCLGALGALFSLWALRLLHHRTAAPS